MTMMTEMMTHLDDFLVLPAVTSSPIMIPICNIHPSWQFLCTRWYKYSSLNWTKFSFHSIPHKQRFNLQRCIGAAKASVVKVGVKPLLKKPLLNATVNAGRIVNAGLTFYCPVFFNARASVSNWSQFAHKTRYRCIAEAWEENFS